MPSNACTIVRAHFQIPKMSAARNAARVALADSQYAHRRRPMSMRGGEAASTGMSTRPTTACVVVCRSTVWKNFSSPSRHARSYIDDLTVAPVSSAGISRADKAMRKYAADT